MIRNNTPTKQQIREDLKTTFKVCRLVFTSRLYLGIFLLITPIFLTVLLLPTDHQIILDIVVFGDASLRTRLSVIYNILPLTGGTTYTVFTDVMMYMVSLLVSMNITLLLYHLKEHGLEFQNTAGGTLSSLLGVFGAGCASCGSALLTAVFSVFGISGALTILPLHGGEFLIIAIAVSLLSIIWMSKGLKGGMVRGCPI